MSNRAIGRDTRVTLHFSLKLEDGAVIDTNFDKQPASFTFGDGNLLKGFEDKLIGMNSGQTASFVVAPEQGFGQHNPTNVQRFARTHFAHDMQLETGLMISFADASQSELAGVVTSVGADMVEVDFNHPLAGRSIYFDVKIINIETIEMVSIDNSVSQYSVSQYSDS